MRASLRSGLALLAAAALGCGTLTSGTTQSLRVTTVPTDAQVSLYRLDGETVAGPADGADGVLATPRPTKFIPYLSVISRDGYCPAYALTKVNPTPGYMAEALLIAIPFIQVIGVALVSVDDRTGGCCAVEPIVVELEEAERCE